MPGLVTGSKGTVGLQCPQQENWDLTWDQKAVERARTSKEMCVCRDTRPMSQGSPACASCPEGSPAAAWDVSVAIKGRQRCQMKVGLYKACDTTKSRAAWGRMTACPSLSPRDSSLLHPHTEVTFSRRSLLSRLYPVQTGSSVLRGAISP